MQSQAFWLQRRLTFGCVANNRSRLRSAEIGNVLAHDRLALAAMRRRLDKLLNGETALP